MTEPDHKGRRPQDGITTASDVSGGAIGAVLGEIWGGPAGAAAGAVIGPLATRAIRRVAVELQQRFLGPGEERRIATALSIAGEEIAARIKAGDSVRQDGFATADEEARSPGEELAEGVLLVVQREYEEKKVWYEAHFLAALPFQERLWIAEAHFFLRALQQMSYRELVLLSFLARLDELQVANAPQVMDFTDPRNLRFLPDLFIHEARNLERFGLVEARGLNLSAADHDARRLQLTNSGKSLFALAGLSHVPREELRQFIGLFQR